ncbi:hypothetical protein BSLG_009928 [Batrachochytrium salamandrivorans]|nr:hypothetical protein BSLG_009928 [Batrachochytrium salamandrivorans]
MPVAENSSVLARTITFGSLGPQRVATVMNLSALDNFGLPWSSSELDIVDPDIPAPIPIQFGYILSSSSFGSILKTDPADEGFCIVSSQADKIRAILRRGLYQPTPEGEDLIISKISEDDDDPIAHLETSDQLVLQAKPECTNGETIIVVSLEDDVECESSQTAHGKPTEESLSTLESEIPLSVKYNAVPSITPPFQTVTPPLGSPTTSVHSDQNYPPTPESMPLKPGNWSNLLKIGTATRVGPVAVSVSAQTNSLSTHGVSSRYSSSKNHTLSPKGLTDKIKEAKAVLDSSPLYQGKLIRPRGLVNNGNICFMNAILQPLLHCPPLYNFYKSYERVSKHCFQNKTPLTDSMLLFLSEFKEEAPNNTPLPTATRDYLPFVGEYVYDALRELKSIDSVKGRQEDAEEFLGFLLEGLHEELLFINKRNDEAGGISNSISANGKGAHGVSSLGHGAIPNNDVPTTTDTWLEIGKKNKKQVTRNTEVKSTPISRIFGGRMRSVVKCSGSKDSPSHVKTIEDALVNLTTPEVLEGFMSSARGGVRVDATKQNYIESLPPVLILHLKRFVYDSVGGTQKVHKHIGYSSVLKISPKILSPSVRVTDRFTEYRLFAIVNHHGKHAAGGHYTCDVLRQNETWLHIDDDEISTTTLAEVTQERRDRQPYMLFFSKS